ncbi:uncharacterized protein BO80DRAFT_234334 [Aspergillus ibericus CBS 121593]|uniref:Uncharacterized protein n=1 Tax=Aspergillus ibericus CBS 121593 TaxID=1448316 RepID=A0A395HB48_9EURO|nr:hypothetical protein BO80DRAFT_234334 [Aspergillus ibericus CBS 121593]RAL04355.1 hypothetical protein BO80DRAFT_234334 [Aspergillus ibericus CBS 121593]
MLHLILETTEYYYTTCVPGQFSSLIPISFLHLFFFTLLNPTSFNFCTLLFTLFSVDFFLLPYFLCSYLSYRVALIVEALVVIDSSGNGFMKSRKILTFFSVVLLDFSYSYCVSVKSNCFFAFCALFFYVFHCSSSPFPLHISALSFKPV